MIKESEDQNRTENSFFDVEVALRCGFCVFGNSGSGKTNLAKLLAEKLRQRGIIVYVLDSSRQWFDFPFNHTIEVSRDRTRYEWVGSTLFDISGLNINDKVKFANMLCQTLLDSHIKAYCPWEFVVFEEAQLFLSNNALRNLSKYGSVLNLVSMGRNYNLRYGLISQFPSYVDKYLVRNTQQRYFGYIFEPNDYRYARQILGKEWVQKLKTLEVGEFLYQCKNRVQKIRVPLFGSLEEKNAYVSFQYSYQVV